MKGHRDQPGHCIVKRNEIQELGLEPRLDVWLVGWLVIFFS